MSRWRTYVLLFFLLTPALVFAVAGGWALWDTGRLMWMWVAVPFSWAIAFLLAKAWGEKLVPLELPGAGPNLHWTPRDKQAWELVETRIAAVGEIDPESFTRLQYYVDVAQTLSHDIACVYHPKATDPLGSLTIPEIMAAGQLAMEDLAELYDQYVPGGHLLTVNNFKSLAKLPKRYKLAANILNLAAAFVNPIAAAGRYAASKTVLSPISKVIESNLLVWFHTAFLQRVGFYVIEMNSGRLKGGTKKFREAFERFRTQDKPWQSPDEATPDEPPTDEVPMGDDHIATAETGSAAAAAPENEPRQSPELELSVCIVGQTGAGKSSVIAALFEDDAEADPEGRNSSVRDRRVVFPGTGDRLQLVEIAYGTGEDSRVRRKDRFRAMSESDLVLLVAAANSPARNADVDFLNDMTAWFDEQRHLKPPPVVVVLTHVDLLKPPMEWSPPYDWQQPTGSKAESIRDAVAHVRETFGERVVEVAPVCSDAGDGRAFGFDQWLGPVVATALEEARACSSVRYLHEEIGSGSVRRVLDQVWNIGKALRGK